MPPAISYPPPPPPPSPAYSQYNSNNGSRKPMGSISPSRLVAAIVNHTQNREIEQLSPTTSLQDESGKANLSSSYSSYSETASSILRSSLALAKVAFGRALQIARDTLPEPAMKKVDLILYISSNIYDIIDGQMHSLKDKVDKTVSDTAILNQLTQKISATKTNLELITENLKHKTAALKTQASPLQAMKAITSYKIESKMIKENCLTFVVDIQSWKVTLEQSFWTLITSQRLTLENAFSKSKSIIHSFMEHLYDWVRLGMTQMKFLCLFSWGIIERYVYMPLSQFFTFPFIIVELIDVRTRAFKKVLAERKRLKLEGVVSVTSLQNCLNDVLNGLQFLYRYSKDIIFLPTLSNISEIWDHTMGHWFGSLAEKVLSWKDWLNGV